ncbi:hypothetical protein ACH5RR_006620 [Cinchona calisaya]|uniref:Uncharacterized protein n=1 Tax=Cinchona calisaya TaxID=153742 RepID=A0ABD3APG7_9GENT
MSHHLKSNHTSRPQANSKPIQILSSDHNEQPNSEPGSYSSSNSKVTKGGFDSHMNDDSSSEDGLEEHSTDD